jgi:membrane protein
MNSRTTLTAALWRLYEDSGITLAGAVAYSFLVSLFPFCIFLGSLAGFFGGRELAVKAAAQLVEILPQRVAEALAPEVEAIMSTTRYDLMTFSAFLALVFATGALQTLREALNGAYRVSETRSYITHMLVSVLFVLFVAASVLVLTAGLVVWPAIVARLEPDWLARPEAAWLKAWLDSHWLSDGMRYGSALALIAVLLAAMHKWLAAGRRTLREIWPGLALTLLLVLIIAIFYSRYVDLNDYTRFYAGLSQVMATLIFFWLTAVVIILGAELNRGLIEIKRLRDGKRLS